MRLSIAGSIGIYRYSLVRAFAKTCFAGKPEILVQFKPIPKGHGGGGEDETPPVEPPENK